MRGFLVGNVPERFFTSESVCAGHPDKICDQISDACVDAVLTRDPYGRVAIETMAGANHLVLMGEVGTTAKIDFERIAREQVHRLGYTDHAQNFTHLSPVTLKIHEQSPEIAVGVESKGAGDQGMMFGYACTETPQRMPMPITLAHALAQKIDEVRESGKLPYLKPDGKTQITVEYQNGKPCKVTNVVVAAPHKREVQLGDVRQDIFLEVIVPVLGKYDFTVQLTQVIVNGTGTWHSGGPATDTGLTGRKIVVDTYGGYARVGGGAFSGKDPSKVDRSGAYGARFIANNIVAHGLAERAEVQLAWAIGQRQPLMQEIETYDTETVPLMAVRDFASKVLDTSVEGIIEGLKLRRPIYLQTAAYGHFGRPGFPWEEIKKDI
ncbi:methionine adenosyltransferase [Candidatus Curtissbacteria bacterium RIFCSPHIGHO2_01_FULL_41_11]|uniref:Methionine adenosyltransferase n=1 Tax=Candidatus Curtissbacteria bacterium RIFCSPHIGHO2_01_FULL_41_11 TaxID=1797711 RepID=A0A1F5G3X3_9BACT|nr:MAG: methionine adenosyltransferase [Candidatus Curtissbacteria bacterium RIFCSPHIGHO2_01_FULL_41_11]